jgi:hypothetical protein
MNILNLDVMMRDHTTPLCPIPGLGHCVGERCNYWDPDKGCLGVGLCFDAEPPAQYSQPELFGENIILSCYEDPD